MGFTKFIVIAVFLCTVASQAPFDPEEMLFIYTRCMEDNLKDDSSRQTTFIKWKDWQLEPKGDQSTHCYVKCVLEKTGMYNPSAKKFDEKVIKKQSEEYPNLAKNVDAYANAVGQLHTTEDDCTAVFNAYDKVFQKYLTTTKNLFHGNKDLTDKIYKELQGNIRQKNQSYFEYCENKFYPAKSEDRRKLCKIRQYEVLDDDVFKNHTECIMKGLRYISKNNQLNLEEIKRDFKQVGKDTTKLEQELKKCNVPKKDVAWEYYKCLVYSSVVNDFKEAFDYREVRSQNYGYHLAKKREYKEPSVKAEVMKIDDIQCPTVV